MSPEVALAQVLHPASFKVASSQATVGAGGSSQSDPSFLQTFPPLQVLVQAAHSYLK